MSLINTSIPTQGFEIVRDTIGAVLKIELEKQKTLKGFDYPINVYTERSAPFDQTEEVMIMVSLDSANYTNTNEMSTHGLTSFNVDIYASAKQTPLMQGGYASSKKRDFFLGMVRYILQDHHYKTLGLPLGTIMGTYVEGFEIFEVSNNQDANFVKMSRLSFSVRINENQSLWEGIDISTIFTGVKLDLTEKGYQYETIN